MFHDEPHVLPAVCSEVGDVHWFSVSITWNFVKYYFALLDSKRLIENTRNEAPIKYT